MLATVTVKAFLYTKLNYKSVTILEIIANVFGSTGSSITVAVY